ncbi:MAG: hypothetical protein R2852_02560 [Bacteroidia bacterium]
MNKKHRWIYIMTALLVCIIFLPSHFQKGGVDNDFNLIIALFIITISILIFLRFENFPWLERVLISLPFAFFSLFITTLILGPMFVELFYNDKTWFLWETKHRLFINAIYYGLNAAILTILTFAYFKLRSHSKIGSRIDKLMH